MSREPISLMAHLVAGFPDARGSLSVAGGLAQAGADYLEVQFPYSDPTADGPAIQSACRLSLERGFRVDTGFALVSEIVRETARRVPVFVMSYAGLVFARGVERFAHEAKEAGATGLIVPDLMPDYDEGLYAAALANDLAVVPVVAPSVAAERLRRILAIESPFLYAAIRTGITGTKSRIDDSVARFLESIRRPGSALIAGFGVSDFDQAQRLMRCADILVVGSAFVRAVLDAESTGADVRNAVITRVLEITGRAGRVEEEEASNRCGNSIGS